VFSCSKIEQKQLNTWVSFQSAEQPLLGQFSVSGNTHLPLLENQVSNVWSMGKDGRSYWPIKRQAATADRIANHKGRNPQERASLKKRLLRKWMSK